jgi:hypothetical protein
MREIFFGVEVLVEFVNVSIQCATHALGSLLRAGSGNDATPGAALEQSVDITLQFVMKVSKGSVDRIV